jgi:hypothetical protein
MESTTFYNEYFGKLADFHMLSPFNEKDDVFSAFIEAIGLLYPITIQVDIPKGFPYRKLIFTTDSLYGYPHLIPCQNQEESKPMRSWFCLNTPFAETAEGQLNQEIQRLRTWFKQQLNPELPPIISDTTVIKARRIADAFTWENTDELYLQRKEFPARELGDFLKNKVDDKKGYIYYYGSVGAWGTTPMGDVGCDNTNLFLVPYVTDHKIPYLIVDEKEFCGSIDLLSTWIKTFGWGKDIVKYLLPFWSPDNQEISSLGTPELTKDDIDSAISQAGVSEQHKKIVRKHLIKSVRTSKPISFDDVKRWFKEHEGNEEYIDDIMFQVDCEFSCFIIGIRSNNQVQWWLCQTNGSLVKRKKTVYTFGDYIVSIFDNEDCYLLRSKIGHIPYEKYFGRGILSSKFRNKRIAIIGSGAIGSILAECIAHGGAQHIAIFDGDTVESGNICRSSFSNENIGWYKSLALRDKLQKINPYGTVKADCNYIYGSTNYDSQETCLKRLEEYDCIIDCTASNELLHFLSYSLKDKLLLSLCITNLAHDIIVTSNTCGNAYEQRKAFLSAIEQDTQNFYMEGSGCYEPTFKANHSELSSLVTYAIKKISDQFEATDTCSSFIMSYGEYGIIYNPIQTYHLANSAIKLHCSREILLDIKDLESGTGDVIGFGLGSYSKDLKEIYLLSVYDTDNALEGLKEKFELSSGSIDYIGDIVKMSDTAKYAEIIQIKAENPEVNTNNPILIVASGDDLTFQIYLNNRMETFLPDSSLR